MMRDALRWAVCAAIVAAAHAFALWSLSTPEPAAESDAGSPIVTLELSPIVAAPAPPLEPAPEVQPQEAASAPPPPPRPEAAPPAQPEQPPKPEEPQSQRQPQIDPLPQIPPDDPPPVAQRAAPENVTVKPPPETPPPQDTSPPPPPEPPPPPASAAAAAANAETAAAPSAAPGREEPVLPAALRTWRRDLIARIERHKAFPSDAFGHSGVASVAFSLDRDGRLVDLRLAASSGSPALDRAALDLVRRAQPFPAPPPGLGEGELSFVAPIRYRSAASP